METLPVVRAQLDELTTGFRAVLGDGLVGIYAHGSLALGCFSEGRSDIDVLVVSGRSLRPSNYETGVIRRRSSSTAARFTATATPSTRWRRSPE